MRSKAAASLESWSLLAAVAAIATAALILPRAIHTDDLEVIRGVAHSSYADLWTAPFRALYYRPLTSTIAKLGVDAGDANLVLRIVAAALVVASAGVFLRIVRPMVGPARLCGVLCLCGAPFTFVAVAPFGVGIGDSIVGLALLVCVREAQKGDAGSPPVLLFAVAIALAAKESGLVVAAFAAAECLRRRRPGFAALAAALAGGYLAAHAVMIESRPYILRTGYFFDMYSVAEQRQRFGAEPLALRLYNAASNLVSALCYLPYQGQLVLTGAIAATAIAITGTTAIVARYLARAGELRRTWPLVCVIPVNAILGFAYARPRIMFAAYVAVAILLACAVDDLWRKNSRRLAIAVLVAWIAVFASSLVRLARMP